MPPSKSLTQQEIIKWQRKIIRHDKWVIRTRTSHFSSTVKFAKNQLKWTTRQLRLSLVRLSAASHSGFSSSGICWDCWDRVADCESHRNWHTNTGNGFYGGLQFTVETWNNSGGNRFADRADYATREQQIMIASKLSLSNWPVCGARYYVGARY